MTSPLPRTFFLKNNQEQLYSEKERKTLRGGWNWVMLLTEVHAQRLPYYMLTMQMKQDELENPWHTFFKNS